MLGGAVKAMETHTIPEAQQGLQLDSAIDRGERGGGEIGQPCTSNAKTSPIPNTDGP